MASRWKILILDQHEDVLLNLEHVLETAGFDTTLAWHVDAFRRFLAENEYDLVIIGHRPPEIDAAEVLRSLPVAAQTIVLTGPAVHPFEDDYFYRLGAQAVFSKWNSDIAGCIRGTFPATESAARAS
jgi:CheY-like chemotaxis protein